MSSRAALDLRPGSKDSIEFLTILSMANNEQLYTPLSYYIDYKWCQNLRVIYNFMALYELQLLVHLIFIGCLLEAKIWQMVSLSLNGVMLVTELYIGGKTKSGGASKLYAFAHLLCILLCSSLLIFGGKKFLQANSLLAAASTLLFTYRALYWLMIFASMRIHVYQIKETMR